MSIDITLNTDTESTPECVLQLVLAGIHGRAVEGAALAAAAFARETG